MKQLDRKMTIAINKGIKDIILTELDGVQIIPNCDLNRNVPSKNATLSGKYYRKEDLVCCVGEDKNNNRIYAPVTIYNYELAMRNNFFKFSEDYDARVESIKTKVKEFLKTEFDIEPHKIKIGSKYIGDISRIQFSSFYETLQIMYKK